jgi:hypothetical protein
LNRTRGESIHSDAREDGLPGFRQPRRRDLHRQCAQAEPVNSDCAPTLRTKPARQFIRSESRRGDDEDFLSGDARQKLLTRANAVVRRQRSNEFV